MSSKDRWLFGPQLSTPCACILPNRRDRPHETGLRTLAAIALAIRRLRGCVYRLALLVETRDSPSVITGMCTKRFRHSSSVT